ncbi:yemanuclein [Eurosta solidaginis]|uniref:yemanuclein n=1 Tax=Eurosta solidaginis TaxID=178769 RepID=UPI0035317579
MSEMKRVSLTTVSSSASSLANFGVGGSNTAGSSGGINNSALTAASSARFGGPQNADRASAAGSSNADRKTNKTMRLAIELFPTDSCKYPEFNYSRLMHLEKKKLKKLKQKTNGFDNPFNDNDDDVARIARELEKKYGTSYGSGRGRSKKDDLCDIGMGYDESDSFIDNTEAYDEIIPEEMETIEGGFYINCGPLEFQKLHTESTTTKTDEIIKMPNRPRKRVISSSSSESSSSGSDEEADEDAESDGEVSSADTVKGSKNGNAITQPAEKRQRTNSTVNPTTTTKKSKPSQETSNTKKGKVVKNAVIVNSSTSNSPKPSSVGSDSDKERVRQKTVKTTTIKDMLKAKRDNFLKMQEGNGGNGASGNSEGKVINGELKGTDSKSSDEDDSSSSGESDESSDDSDSNDTEPEEKKTNDGGTEKLRTSDTNLPNIEADILSEVQQFKEIVKLKNMTGQRFQFDDSLVEVFLKIDDALLCVEKTQRNMVFAHLEFHLLLPKYFFLRKAKQLRIKEEKMKSKRALAKLRKAIIEAMPNVIANFEADIRKHAELAVNVNTDHPPKMPKKKFPWNNNLRTLLYDVYQVRWTSYPVLGTRKESLEDFINVFLREKVVELWPKDWMRFEELQREIEKRKSATKRAKDKKKETGGNTNTNVINHTTVTSAVAATSSVTVTQSAGTTNTYIKQFEEFATAGSRSSFANSDTESVASSSTSNGLKRKTGGKASAKVAKKQTQSNIPISNNNVDNNKKNLQQLPASTNKESSMKNVLTSNASNNLSPVSTATQPSSSSSLVTAKSISTSSVNLTTTQQQSKHSKSGETENVQVIDLDNYRSPNEILLTSQQLSRPATRNNNAKTALNAPGLPNRRESSSESDGVEIVSVYPAQNNKSTGVTAGSKQKNKRNASSNYAMNALQPGTSSITHNNNNIKANNNNSQNAKGKQTESPVINVPNYDNKQIVLTFKELGDLQQQKTNMTSPQNGSKKDHCSQ